MVNVSFPSSYLSTDSMHFRAEILHLYLFAIIIVPKHISFIFRHLPRAGILLHYRGADRSRSHSFRRGRLSENLFGGTSLDMMHLKSGPIPDPG